MSPPNSLRHPEQGAPALLPGFKVFLSASVLFFGAIGTLPFLLQEKAAVPVPLPTDEQAIAVSTFGGNVPPPSVSAKLEAASAKTAPPSVAERKGKIAQVYPEPILAAAAPLPRTEQSSSDPAVVSTAKPVSVSIREFASVRSFTSSTTAVIGKTPTSFDKRPDSIDSSKIADTLLPMFHFAENLKPLSRERGEQTPPENPFRQLYVGAAVPKEDKKFTPLRVVAELQPLRLRESPAIKPENGSAP